MEIFNKLGNVRIILRLVREIIVEMGTQHSLCVYCWATRHSQQYKNIKCCIRMLLWRIYIAGNNVPCLGLHVEWPIFLSDLNKIWIFLDRFSQKYPISNFMETRAVGAALVYVRTDGRTFQRYHFLSVNSLPVVSLAKAMKAWTVTVSLPASCSTYRLVTRSSCQSAVTCVTTGRHNQHWRLVETVLTMSQYYQHAA